MENKVKVAIIDDIEACLQCLEQIVHRAIPEAEVYKFNCIRAFTVSGIRFQLVVADVMLQGGEVFRNAEIIEARTEYIMYTSVLKEKAVFAYRPKTIGFLSKADSDEANIGIIRTAFMNFIAKTITLDTQNGEIRINPNRIICIEIKGRDLVCRCDNDAEIVLKRTSYRSVQDRLDPYLVEVRKGVYINTRYIRRINGNAVVLANGSEILSSRRALKNVVDRFREMFV